MHRLNTNWKYFNQDFGNRELELIEQRVGKKWTEEWEMKRENKSQVGCFIVQHGHIFMPHTDHTFY